MHKDGKLKREELKRLLQNSEYSKIQTNNRALRWLKEKPFQLRYMEEHGGKAL